MVMSEAERMPTPKDPVADPPDAAEIEKAPGKRGVTRRLFLTNVATAGIAATAGPLLRATPHVIESPQPPAVSNPAGTVPVELKINGQIHQLQIETRVTLLDALLENLDLLGAKKGCQDRHCGRFTAHV